MDDFFDVVYHSSYDAALKILANSKPDVRNSSGNSLLHKAILEDNEEKVSQFVKLGCDVDSCNDSKESAITVAVQRGNLAIVQLLVVAGVDLSIDCSSQTNLRGCFTPLQLAVVSQHPEIVKLLAAKGGIKTQPLLHLAIKNEDLDMLRLLLDIGADLHLLDHHGHTALTRALTHTNTDSLALLLQHEPNLEQHIYLMYSNPLELTPLVYAQILGRHAVFKMLLDAGANLDCNIVTKRLLYKTKGTRCFAPLCFMASTGSLLGIRCLLQANCPVLWPCGHHALEGIDPSNPNYMPYMHDSPLFKAFQHKKYEAATMFLLAGFDLTRICWPTKAIIKFTRNHINNSGFERIFQGYLQNPLSLSVLCRNSIRESMGHNIEENINLLPIPHRLANFILLKGVFDA